MLPLQDTCTKSAHIKLPCKKKMLLFLEHNTYLWPPSNCECECLRFSDLQGLSWFGITGMECVRKAMYCLMSYEETERMNISKQLGSMYRYWMHTTGKVTLQMEENSERTCFDVIAYHERSSCVNPRSFKWCVCHQNVFLLNAFTLFFSLVSCLWMPWFRLKHDVPGSSPTHCKFGFLFLTRKSTVERVERSLVYLFLVFSFGGHK